jgi:di/tricarboxylate transporter
LADDRRLDRAAGADAQGLQNSGALRACGRWLIGFVATERHAALSLVLAAALLFTLLTNDVAFFVVVPLTLGICRSTALPATNLIVFEALAVNAGSALTPIGNPQNLFLWQRSAVSFGEFVVQMLPLVALLMAALLLLTAGVFKARPIVLDHGPLGEAAAAAPLDRTQLGLALALYLPFLVATDLQHGGWAVAAVLLVFALFRPATLAQVDWGLLLLVFVLMFIDLRLLAQWGWVQQGMAGLGLEQARPLFAASVALSQLISNVPAAIALAEYSHDWRVLAYGVNIGGFGFALGSMANLITLRMLDDRRAWWVFHAYSLPALLFSAALGYALLLTGLSA